MGLSIVASIALPGIRGVLVSCLLDGTFTDMISAICTGDWGTLGMCALAFIPGAKALKGLKAIGKADKVIGKALKSSDDITKATKNNFRKRLIETTGKNPGRSAEAHHALPQAHEKFFASKGIDVHDTKYGAWWETASHRSNAYAYNKDWGNAITAGTLNNVEDIENFARGLTGEYGFEILF